MIKIGFVFPGQSSQYVGMGKELIAYHSAFEIFDLANSILGKDLKSLCLDGPEEELQKTINTQPAVFVVSCICLELLKSIGIIPNIVAGHSLGEYSALVASGVIGLKEGLTLVAKRARLMEEAAEKRPGAMAAILGLDISEVAKVVEDLQGEGIINIANFNCPGQQVVSGEKEVIRKAEAIFEKIGAKRVVFLQVDGAFHTPIMKEAEEKLCDYLETISFKDAKVPIVSNSTSQISTDALEIKEALSRQMTSSVSWQQSIEKMLETGVKTFVEVGPGKVLSGLIRRIDKTVNILNIEDDKSFANVRNVLSSKF
jgi:[acyl-carrier-protein] S-malonyltransferase